MKVKYINDDITKGIVIDWKLIQRKLLNLGIPEGDVYIPSLPIDQANFFVEVSMRSVGKTTQYLLIGLLLYKEYGIRTEYVRTREEMTTPKNMDDLYNTIIEFGYILKIFDGKYNDIIYRAKQWHLVKRKEDGEIEERDPEECCHCHNLSQAYVEASKSSYNSPRGDWIILDEFIPVNGITPDGEFLRWCQLLSTIKRYRVSTKIVMAANTINKHNLYFQEMNIRRLIQDIKVGEHKIIVTPKGTPVYVHFIGLNKAATDKRQVINNLYFGFDNPHLSSIVGGAEWEISNYPHLPSPELGEDRDCISKNYYFRFFDDILTLTVNKSSILGTYAFIHEKTTPIPEDEACRIYVLDTKREKRERFGFSKGDKIDKLIAYLYDTKQTYYATNEVGNIFEQFLETYKEGGYT